MICFGRRGPLFGLVLVAAAVVVVAALTTWWVLVAAIPLVMMVGCISMMAGMARMRTGPGMSGRLGCCAGGRPAARREHHELRRIHGP
jgi:hypothetical protein